MKKYIVPKEDNSGWKLVAARGVPSHAVCEAPENWTRAMEPFIEIKTLTVGGEKKCVPSLKQAYHEMINKRASKMVQADLSRMEKVRKSIEKAEANRKFNELNPAQRYVKSILGEFTDVAKPIVFRWALKQIFGDKIP